MHSYDYDITAAILKKLKEYSLSKLGLKPTEINTSRHTSNKMICDVTLRSNRV